MSAPAVEVVDDDTGEVFLGSIVPRLYTPPLAVGEPGPCGCGCALTEETSYGFAVARFADERLSRPLWAWQRWLVIHGGELVNGAPRFRRIIVTVGRQSGKTDLMITLSLFWLFVEQHESILGTSTLLKYAKKPWIKAFDLAVAQLWRELPADPRRKAIRKTSGEEEWWTAAGAHYAIAASNAEGGRSMSNKRVLADEFAKQYDYEAYSAAYYSMDAFEDAQYWAPTTPDPKGVVYKDLRAAALTFMAGGEGDETLALFEWSPPDGAPPDSPLALCAANPTTGRPGGKKLDRLRREARAAVAKGGDLLRTFKTEILCMQVDDDDKPINLVKWRDCYDPGDLSDVRSKVALVFDVAPSQQHCTLTAAAVLEDGRVRLEPQRAWDGPACVDRAIRELPALVAKIRPRAFGWLPGGPAESAAAKLKDRSAGVRRGEWPPRGVVVEEIRAELPAACMGLAQMVMAGRIAHPDDPLLNEDVLAAEKLIRPSGTWVFSRKGDGDCDSLYAAAGAAFLALTLPTPIGDIRILIGDEDD